MSKEVTKKEIAAISEKVRKLAMSLIGGMCEISQLRVANELEFMFGSIAYNIEDTYLDNDENWTEGEHVDVLNTETP